MRLPPLLLDFKQTPRLWSWPRLLLLIAGIAWLLQTIHLTSLVDAQLSNTASSQEILHQHDKTRPSAPPNTQKLQLEISHANDILSRLSLPWSGLFQTLESINADDIALLSIHPEPDKHRLRLSGEAKNLASLLSYITALDKSHVLDHVYLTSHEIRTDSPQQPIRFSLVAHWAEQ